MTGALVAMDRGSIGQYTAGLFICAAAAPLQTAFNPYCEAPENNLAFLVEANIFLVIYLAFINSLHESFFSGDRGKNMGMLMSILTIGVLVFSIVTLNIAVLVRGGRSQFKAGLSSAGLRSRKLTMALRWRSVTTSRKESVEDRSGVEMSLTPQFKGSDSEVVLEEPGSAAKAVHEPDPSIEDAFKEDEEVAMRNRSSGSNPMFNRSI